MAASGARALARKLQDGVHHALSTYPSPTDGSDRDLRRFLHPDAALAEYDRLGPLLTQGHCDWLRRLQRDRGEALDRTVAGRAPRGVVRGMECAALANLTGAVPSDGPDPLMLAACARLCVMGARGALRARLRDGAWAAQAVRQVPWLAVEAADVATEHLGCAGDDGAPWRDGCEGLALAEVLRSVELFREVAEGGVRGVLAAALLSGFAPLARALARRAAADSAAQELAQQALGACEEIISWLAASGTPPSMSDLALTPGAQAAVVEHLSGLLPLIDTEIAGALAAASATHGAHDADAQRRFQKRVNLRATVQGLIADRHSAWGAVPGTTGCFWTRQAARLLANGRAPRDGARPVSPGAVGGGSTSLQVGGVPRGVVRQLWAGGLRGDGGKDVVDWLEVLGESEQEVVGGVLFHAAAWDRSQGSETSLPDYCSALCADAIPESHPYWFAVGIARSIAHKHVADSNVLPVLLGMVVDCLEAPAASVSQHAVLAWFLRSDGPGARLRDEVQACGLSDTLQRALTGVCNRMSGAVQKQSLAELKSDRVASGGRVEVASPSKQHVATSEQLLALAALVPEHAFSRMFTDATVHVGSKNAMLRQLQAWPALARFCGHASSDATSPPLTREVVRALRDQRSKDARPSLLLVLASLTLPSAALERACQELPVRIVSDGADSPPPFPETLRLRPTAIGGDTLVTCAARALTQEVASVARGIAQGTSPDLTALTLIAEAANHAAYLLPGPPFSVPSGSPPPAWLKSAVFQKERTHKPSAASLAAASDLFKAAFPLLRARLAPSEDGEALAPVVVALLCSANDAFQDLCGAVRLVVAHGCHGAANDASTDVQWSASDALDALILHGDAFVDQQRCAASRESARLLRWPWEGAGDVGTCVTFLCMEAMRACDGRSLTPPRGAGEIAEDSAAQVHPHGAVRLAQDVAALSFDRLTTACVPALAYLMPRLTSGEARRAAASLRDVLHMRLAKRRGSTGEPSAMAACAREILGAQAHVAYARWSEGMGRLRRSVPAATCMAFDVVCSAAETAASGTQEGEGRLALARAADVAGEMWIGPGPSSQGAALGRASDTDSRDLDTVQNAAVHVFCLRRAVSLAGVAGADRSRHVGGLLMAAVNSVAGVLRRAAEREELFGNILGVRPSLSGADNAPAELPSATELEGTVLGCVEQGIGACPPGVRASAAQALEAATVQLRKPPPVHGA
ncbi:unnamed protein product [Pedinophyceae sp. YPF-701]|nr:unnamed protein product [Pedinophyceae sp. YPF-701]